MHKALAHWQKSPYFSETPSPLPLCGLGNRKLHLVEEMTAIVAEEYFLLVEAQS